MTLMELIDAYAEADALEHQACLHGSQEDFAEAISVKHKARTAVLEAVEKLERDAARYRWLRENKYIWSDFSYIAHSSKKVVGIEFQWFAVEAEKNPTREHLDAAIDAAMEATNGQGD